MDGDSSDVVDYILGHHKGVLRVILLISLSRSGTIGQDEVEDPTFTVFPVFYKANECINHPRLEPLLKDRGFSLKLKQGMLSGFTQKICELLRSGGKNGCQTPLARTAICLFSNFR